MKGSGLFDLNATAPRLLMGWYGLCIYLILGIIITEVFNYGYIHHVR